MGDMLAKELFSHSINKFKIKTMSVEEKKESCLYVGADDSNNHDKNRAKIVCATFSILPEDSGDFLSIRIPKIEDFDKWLKGSKHREYRFGLLTDPEFMKMQPILPFCLPRLILDYVPNMGYFPKQIFIGIDGPLPRRQGEYLQKYLGNYFREGVSVVGFVKRKAEKARTPKRERDEMPPLIGMAHIKAKHIYNNLSDYVESARLVELGAERLKNIYRDVMR